MVRREVSHFDALGGSEGCAWRLVGAGGASGNPYVEVKSRERLALGIGESTSGQQKARSNDPIDRASPPYSYADFTRWFRERSGQPPYKHRSI